MLKKTDFKRKAALTLAVLGTISPMSSVLSMINGDRVENVAEAAEGRHALSEEERIAAGYPAIPGMTFYSDGTAYKVVVIPRPSKGWGSEKGMGHTGKILSYDKDSIVLDDDIIVLWGGSGRRNSITAFTTSGRYTEVGKDTNANRDMFKSLKNYHLEEVCTAYEDTVATGQGSTFDTHKELSNVCSYKLVPLNTGANSEDVKKFMKEAGVDTEGETVKITKPMETQDINVDGRITTTGDIEAGGDVIVHGSETIDHDLTVKGDETVDGDSRIHGNQTIDGGQTIYGDSNVKGSQRIQEDLRVDGNTQLGNDKGKDTLNVWAKTNLHGDTTIGDDEKDKFVVNANSEFKADATFDKDVAVKGKLEVNGDSTIHGNSTVDGDSTIHGNETVDKNIHVKGDSEVDGNSSVHGNSSVDGDLNVKGNTTLGDDKNNDTLDVNAKTHLHGDTTIGDDTNDKLTINATTEFGGESTFNKDVHIKGDLETDGNSTTHGNTITDGNVLIYGNAGVAQNFYVGGDAKVDGDVYGKSFNIGGEKYIDKDGINANNHKIRNVADGEIGPNSLDAVNGRQLWHTREALQHNINQVGAGAAAMASLHPLDYEHDDKLSVSAAMGNYKDKTAMAVGAFYRPNIKSMINLSGTLGYGDNMFGIGVTTKMGKVTEADTMTDEQLRDKVSEIHDENKELREENGNLKAEVSGLKAEITKSNEQNTAQENQIAALSTKNADLEKSLSDMTVAYNQLMSKVDGIVAKLASLKADSQK